MAYKFQPNIMTATIENSDKDYILQGLVKDVCNHIFSLNYTNLAITIYIKQWFKKNDKEIAVIFKSHECEFEFSFSFYIDNKGDTLLSASNVTIIKEPITVLNQFHPDSKIYLQYDENLKISRYGYFKTSEFRTDIPMTCLSVVFYHLEVTDNLKQSSISLQSFECFTSYSVIKDENNIKKDCFFVEMLNSFGKNKLVQELFDYIDFENIARKEIFENCYKLFLQKETIESINSKRNIISMILI